MKIWLCRLEGTDVHEFGDVRLEHLPRIGEQVVSQVYDGTALWEVLMVQHLDLIGPRLIVRPYGNNSARDRYDDFPKRAPEGAPGVNE